MRFAIVAHRAGETNIGLITRRWSVFEPLLLTPREALMTLAPGDAALGRLDIREGLDGIEDGLWALSELSASGTSVLNPPSALISAHVACELAVAAAAAIGGDLVGVDLLPLGPGRYVVLEINAAVDFTSDYSVGEDVFDGVVSALVRRAGTIPTSLPLPESAAAAA
jgi:hypothetical protein